MKDYKDLSRKETLVEIIKDLRYIYDIYSNHNTQKEDLLTSIECIIKQIDRKISK